MQASKNRFMFFSLKFEFFYITFFDLYFSLLNLLSVNILHDTRLKDTHFALIIKKGKRDIKVFNN